MCVAPLPQTSSRASKPCPDDVRLCRYRRSSSRSPSASPRPCRSPSPSSSPGPASPRWMRRCEVRLSRSSTWSTKERTRDCTLTLACCSRRRLPLCRRPTQVSHQVPWQCVLFLLAQLWTPRSARAARADCPPLAAVVNVCKTLASTPGPTLSLGLASLGHMRLAIVLMGGIKIICASSSSCCCRLRRLESCFR